MVVRGSSIRSPRCSLHALRKTANIKMDAKPTSDTCASFSQPNGAAGMQMGQPTQYAHAPVTFTMRPAIVNTSTAINSIKTRRANDVFSEYFILLPVFANRTDNQ